MSYDAILFDFDGVLLESEYEGNRHLAEYLTSIGHPTSVADSMAHFMGLAGQDFIDAVERHIGQPLPPDFQARREAENERVLREGVGGVDGAAAFVRDLPDALPRAIASSSSTRWIRTHLDHLGIADAFSDHIYSGKEHVRHGKPAPDIYLHAADALGVDIGRSVILEDSPVGVRGALASGAHVIGVAVGRHCGPEHVQRLRALGVRDIATSYADVKRLIGLG